MLGEELESASLGAPKPNPISTTDALRNKQFEMPLL